jgi:hypothetical protein
MLPSWFLWSESGGHPLLPVLQHCPCSGSTWTAVVTNNPSCIEPGNSLFPQPSASPSPFSSSSGWVFHSPVCSKQQWASFFREFHSHETSALQALESASI